VEELGGRQPLGAEARDLLELERPLEREGVERSTREDERRLGSGEEPRRGVEPWHMRNGTYLEDLATAGVKPDDVDLVVCTHLHVDHVGWNTRLEGGRWVPTFPTATYIFARDEFEFWKQESATGREEFGLIDDSVMPIVEAGRALLVAGDHVIDDRLQFEPSR